MKRLTNKRGDAVMAGLATVAFITVLFANASVNGGLKSPNWNKEKTIDNMPGVHHGPMTEREKRG